MVAAGPGLAPDAVPELSVLIPAYNAAASIDGALDSVLEATVSLECLVIDDASSDDTAARVEARAAADPRVRLLRQAANAGVSEARNRGLDAARGRWVTFLDADDRFTPGGLDLLVAATARPGVHAVVGQQVWTSAARRWISGFYDRPDIREAGRKSLAAAPGLLYYASPHAKVVEASLVTDLRFRGRVLGDQPWVIRALLRARDGIAVLSDVVYLWQRPADDAPATSITATTRASAARGIEATIVAAEALRTVSEEAATTIADPAARERLLAAYVERLLESDLAMHVSLGLRRSDPDLGSLFAAIETFLGTVPPARIADSDALARSIVEPPLRAWSHVVPAARGPYRSLLRAASQVQPHLDHHATPPFGELGLRLARRGGGEPLAGLVLAGQRLARMDRIRAGIGALRRRA